MTCGVVGPFSLGDVLGRGSMLVVAAVAAAASVGCGDQDRALGPSLKTDELRGTFDGVGIGDDKARVTVIEAQDRLLAREEPFAGDELRTALGRQGVDVHVGVSASAVSRDGDEITMTLEDGERLTGDRLLVAIGRRPLTDDLGLETVGLPGGAIDVDDHLG